jgi:hypothetical protein
LAGESLGRLPRALAIDGKWIRNRACLCLSDHETGAPVAGGFAAQVSKTDENKREGEQTVALELYSQNHLEGATVTDDALITTKPRPGQSSTLVAIILPATQKRKPPRLPDCPKHRRAKPPLFT